MLENTSGWLIGHPHSITKGSTAVGVYCIVGVDRIGQDSWTPKKCIVQFQDPKMEVR